ncbi:DUF4159 domain-containing protein [Indioceanicola profundi]|uniref:DUF4159 domain-containing protein n=1 Tax=Indioceanicola profundi TaxID=2220096 RepID=UPI000E6A9625|nr:DUF4159 domain-containing protein [Indioceanicola profundi]
MLSLGPLAFAAPWLLAALAVLPVVWLLLRVTPPAPRTIDFPAIRLLRDLTNREETPARTPLWLLILRMLLAALIILALARPLLNPDAVLPDGGPLLLVVDNGWAAGRDWPSRQETMERLIDQAERSDRDVVMLATAPGAGDGVPRLVGPMVAADARREAQALAPVPWSSDHAAALKALEAFQPDGTPYTVWLAEGLAGEGTPALVDRLRRMGGLEVVGDGAERPALLLRPPAGDPQGLTVPVERSFGGLPQPVTLRATGEDGRLLATGEAAFEPGQTRTEVRLELPTELRNEVTAVRLDAQTTAGATILLDERWRRRPVGLVSGRPEGENQPLLSEIYYLNRALAPFAEVRQGTTADLMARELAVLILADVGSLTGPEAEGLTEWVENGGLLVRFAGPRLAQNADELVPVRLRAGDRALGGALSWSEPARLAPFAEESPFQGLRIPPDVTVSRQVLAEPSVELQSRTWARLADGTPLVTAEKRGAGWIVLVHTTASPDWSNLAISGLFVEMLQRMVALSSGVAAEGAAGTLPPLELLDGLGRLAPPPATAFPVSARQAMEQPAEVVGPRHPPGFYGTAEARQALNLSPAVPELRPLQAEINGLAQGLYGARGEVDLKPWLLAAALALAVIDLFIGLGLRGLLGRPGRIGKSALGRFARRGAAVLAVITAAGLAVPPEVSAQDWTFGARSFAPPPDPDTMSPEERAIAATSENWLAFVRTGDGSVDQTSSAGLTGLGHELERRTAVEIAGAMPVDLETDELAFYPMIYWPVTPGQASPSEAAKARLNEYLRNGGMLLVDTRDQAFGSGGPGGPFLEEMLSGIDVPPLAPVPPEHVLTKAFYLLQDFPGRYAGGDVWVEATEGRTNDGVSPVIVGSNDWAGAWAVNDQGRPMNAVVPGPERQREMAYRFGINLVMYALTGNYKADQVHVPAILERLGQ